MKILVVIDTNVLVSALLTQNSAAATVNVLNAVFDNRIIPLYNMEIIEEYRDVLCREKFNFSKELVNIVIQSIIDNGVNSERIPSSESFEDKDDVVFYEVCLSKLEDHSLLVTGNKKHFPQKTFIVTPKELMEILSSMI